MNRQEILNLISTIEDELPVYDWQYNGIDLWPLCKWMIFTEIFYANQEKKDAINQPQLSFIKRKLSQFTFYGRGLLKYFQFLRHLKKTEVIFLGASSHRVHFKGSFINRYYEPLKNDYNSYLFLELSLNLKENYPKDPTINLEDFYAFFVLKNKFYKKKNTIKLVDFEKLTEYIPSFVDVQHLRKELLSRAKLVENYATLFRQTFLKSKPQVVYSLCYYSLPNHAFHLAANQLNIPNYDIQHGGQGPMHTMYTYHQLPKLNRVNTLPERFWVWDTESYNHLKSWIPTDIGYEIENKGNPWWDYAIQNFKNTEELSNKKIILYTLQFDSLDNYILDAIAETPDDYVWFLRVHPRQPQSKEIISNQLKTRNLWSKVDIDNASNLPLPVLLNKCIVHISKYSGSIIEADQLGVKSIILESVGIKTFKDIIHKGSAIGIEEPTSAKLVDTILSMEVNHSTINGI